MFYYGRYDPVPRDITLLCFQKITEQLDQPVICGENSSKTGGKSSFKKVSTGRGPIIWTPGSTIFLFSGDVSWINMLLIDNL
jgi:hypothetical protein